MPRHHARDDGLQKQLLGIMNTGTDWQIWEVRIKKSFDQTEKSSRESRELATRGTKSHLVKKRAEAYKCFVKKKKAPSNGKNGESWRRGGKRGRGYTLLGKPTVSCFAENEKNAKKNRQRHPTH